MEKPDHLLANQLQAAANERNRCKNICFSRRRYIFRPPSCRVCFLAQSPVLPSPFLPSPVHETFPKAPVVRLPFWNLEAITDVMQLNNSNSDYSRLEIRPVKTRKKTIDKKTVARFSESGKVSVFSSSPNVEQRPKCMDHAILHGKPFGNCFKQ